MTRITQASEDVSTASPPLDLAAVQYLVHHVFLPPKLPQQDDGSIEMDHLLITLVSECLRDSKVVTDGAPGYECLENMVQDMLEIHDASGYISESRLRERLEALSDTCEHPSSVLPSFFPARLRHCAVPLPGSSGREP